MADFDKLRGTPKGYTATSKNTPEHLKKVALAASLMLSVSPLSAPATETKTQDNDGHKIEIADYTKTNINSETTYKSEVELNFDSWENIKTVRHTVSEDGVKTRHNGEVKAEHSDVVTENFEIRNGVASTKIEQTKSEDKYYSNGEHKSIYEFSSEYNLRDASAWGIAQGHTDAHQWTETDETTVKYNRKGEIKETQSHSSLSSNLGTEIRVDSYDKGDIENPKKMMQSRLMDDSSTGKILRIYNNSKSKNYSAYISENIETYDMEKNGKNYYARVGSKGNIDSVKYIEQEDGTFKEEKLNDLSSKRLLNKMRRKSNHAIKKLTDKEYKNAKQYFNDISAKQGNTVKLGDYFEKEPENFNDIKQHVEETSENKFSEKTTVTADGLLQQKLRDSKILAEKTGRGGQHSSFTKQTNTANLENASTNTALMQHIGYSR